MKKDTTTACNSFELYEGYVGTPSTFQEGYVNHERLSTDTISKKRRGRSYSSMIALHKPTDLMRDSLSRFKPPLWRICCRFISEGYRAGFCLYMLQISRFVTKTLMWRLATLFSSNCILGRESWHAFLERLFPHRALQASLLWGASYDSLANYASLTTFGHIMVNSITLARKHLSNAVRQIMLPCARICFLSAPFYGS